MALGGAARALLRPLGLHVERLAVGQDLLRDVKLVIGTPVLTAFDVGANVGRTTLEFARAFAGVAVHAFEPLPELYGRLVENTRSLARVRTYDVALGEVEGAGVFHVAADPVGSSLLAFVPGVERLGLGSWTVERGETPVRVRRLDAVAAAERVATIDLLKTDAQGADLLVLRGAGDLLRPGSVKAVVCEVLFEEVYAGQPLFGEIHAFLTGRGYRLVGLYHAARDRRGRIVWGDALYA